MRPAEDLAFRARNWFWYWRVRGISGLSNDALDRKSFGGDTVRRRHFERLQQSASSPDQIPLVDGQTLLEIVDRWDYSLELGYPYAPATADFRSPLWDFLAARDATPAFYSSHIQRYAERFGWVRLNTSDFSLYRAFLGEDEPGLQSGVSRDYSAMLHMLVAQGTPDALAVLIALFREALHGVLLEEAIAIKIAIKTCLGLMIKSTDDGDPPFPNEFGRFLWRLVDDRVLANRWVFEADWRAQTGTLPTEGGSSRTRNKEFRSYVKWYANGNRRCNDDYGHFPIVPASPRLDWIKNNRAHLESAYNQIVDHQVAHTLANDDVIAHGTNLQSHCPPDELAKRFGPFDFVIARLPFTGDSSEK